MKSLKKSDLLFSTSNRENVISGASITQENCVSSFLKKVCLLTRRKKIAIMGKKSAFCLTHDSADSTKNQIILQETDKLDSDWDVAVVFFSKYPRYYCLMLNIHKPLDPTCIFMV